MTKDQRFYKYCWDNSDHNCAECGRELPDTPSPINFSHVLPKGKYPNLRHHPDNIDILCYLCHQRWEFGDRKYMKIYSEARLQALKELDKMLSV